MREARGEESEEKQGDQVQVRIRYRLDRPMLLLTLQGSSWAPASSFGLFFFKKTK